MNICLAHLTDTLPFQLTFYHHMNMYLQTFYNMIVYFFFKTTRPILQNTFLKILLSEALQILHKGEIEKYLFLCECTLNDDPLRWDCSTMEDDFFLYRWQ